MIITADNPKWDEYIQKLPLDNQDIYFTSQYYLLEEKEGHGLPQLFVFTDDTDNLGIYPFLKRPINSHQINGHYYDIETAYGYGGPLVKNKDADFIEKFESAFLQYCQDENIIAEFVRFHPLIKNETIFKKRIQVLHNRKTVWLDLTPNIETIWMYQISTQNRNIIRKCQKNNLSIQINRDYEEFIKMYEETMDKVGADSFYFFGKEYYDFIRNNCNCTLLSVTDGKETIAAAIFMGYGNYFHYHLSGSKKDALRLSPNNLLLWEAIQYAQKHGYKKMHFGGGLSDSTEDNLFKFKSRFSKNYADFYIGKRIHNQEVYKILIDNWEAKHGERAQLFLQYRV